MLIIVPVNLIVIIIGIIFRERFIMRKLLVATYIISIPLTMGALYAGTKLGNDIKPHYSGTRLGDSWDGDNLKALAIGSSLVGALALVGLVSEKRKIKITKKRK